MLNLLPHRDVLWEVCSRILQMLNLLPLRAVLDRRIGKLVVG